MKITIYLFLLYLLFTGIAVAGSNSILEDSNAFPFIDEPGNYSYVKQPNLFLPSGLWYYEYAPDTKDVKFWSIANMSKSDTVISTSEIKSLNLLRRTNNWDTIFYMPPEYMLDFSSLGYQIESLRYTTDSQILLFAIANIPVKINKSITIYEHTKIDFQRDKKSKYLYWEKHPKLPEYSIYFTYKSKTQKIIKHFFDDLYIEFITVADFDGDKRPDLYLQCAGSVSEEHFLYLSSIAKKNYLLGLVGMGSISFD